MKVTTSRGKKQQAWKPLFWPDMYVKEKPDLTLAGNKLSDAKLHKYGKKVSQLRKI